MKPSRWEVFVLTSGLWMTVVMAGLAFQAWAEHQAMGRRLEACQQRVEEAEARQAERRWQVSAHHLRHDAAFETAKTVVALIAHLLREEEHKDAVLAVYEVIKAGLDDYEVKANRMQKRLAKPGRN